MNHILKTWPEFWDEVRHGNKTFEIRENDRCFKVGDTLTLERWCPQSKSVVPVVASDVEASRIVVTVSYMLLGGNFGLSQDACILAFKSRLLKWEPIGASKAREEATV
jgi:hypothetical protein